MNLGAIFQLQQGMKLPGLGGGLGGGGGLAGNGGFAGPLGQSPGLDINAFAQQQMPQGGKMGGFRSVMAGLGQGMMQQSQPQEAPPLMQTQTMGPRHSAGLLQELMGENFLGRLGAMR